MVNWPTVKGLWVVFSEERLSEEECVKFNKILMENGNKLMTYVAN